jgi:hypothetical protein
MSIAEQDHSMMGMQYIREPGGNQDLLFDKSDRTNSSLIRYARQQIRTSL